MCEILRVGWIDPRGVPDALSIRGHDSGHKGQTCTHHGDPYHDITCSFTGENYPRYVGLGSRPQGMNHYPLG